MQDVATNPTSNVPTEPTDVADSPLFAFDLDGTVTTTEMLPVIAHELGLYPELSLLTRMTLAGAIDFQASFRLRFTVLRQVPLARVQAIAAAIPLEPEIAAFITEHAARCAIVTGNLDRWVEPLTRSLGCAVYASRAEERNGELHLAAILDKGEAVRDMAARSGRPVVAVGDAANDIPMLEAASFGIAYGGVRAPTPALIAVADAVAYDAASLCRMLREYL